MNIEIRRDERAGWGEGGDVSEVRHCNFGHVLINTDSLSSCFNNHEYEIIIVLMR